MEEKSLVNSIKFSTHIRTYIKTHKWSDKRLRNINFTRARVNQSFNPPLQTAKVPVAHDFQYLFIFEEWSKSVAYSTSPPFIILFFAFIKNKTSQNAPVIHAYIYTWFSFLFSYYFTKRIT